MARARIAAEIASALSLMFSVDVTTEAENSRLMVETGSEIAACLIDAGLPTGIALAERITASDPGLPVIFVAEVAEREMLAIAARLQLKSKAFGLTKQLQRRHKSSAGCSSGVFSCFESVTS